LPEDPRTQLADLVGELVDPVEHAETYRLRSAVPGGGPTQEIRVHRTRHPPLLDQLAAAVTPSGSDGRAAGGFESAPTARLDVIDCLTDIYAGISEYTTITTTPHHALRRLVGDSDLTDRDLKRLIRDLKGWITMARIITDWQGPSRRLRVPCMVCGERTLRARVNPKTEAGCTSCRSTWRADDGGIMLLSEYIKDYNAGRYHAELEAITE